MFVDPAIPGRYTAYEQMKLRALLRRGKTGEARGSMGYYDDEQNVQQYIDMAEGYDGALLIAALRQWLTEGAHVLELGMGPGKDLLLLAEHYAVTGSDSSQVFVDRFLAAHPDADVLVLDALSMATERKFDGLYSNKVLYHLQRDDLAAAFSAQARVLKPGGIALHSFWFGEHEEDTHGLHFAYYTETLLRAATGPEYEVLAVQRYAEMDEGDSLYVVLRRLAPG